MSDDFVPARGFIEILDSREDGELIPELDGLVRKLTALCESRAGVGSISVTIKMRKETKYEEPIFLIEHDVVLKEPKKPRKAGFLFADQEGNLTRYKPEQRALEGMELVPSKVIPININEETGEIDE
jgi:hypothetical protein